MKMTNNHIGDDLFLDRLHSYLESQLPFQIKSITPIRNHVFFVETSNLPFILKGFSSYHRLRLQEELTAKLREDGFPHTYSFLNLSKDPPLYFEKKYYGILEYISPSKDNFSFSNSRDREAGTQILETFHSASSRLVPSFNSKIGSYRLVDRWRLRTAKFLNNISVTKFFVQKEMIDEILDWADWSLKGLENELSSIQKGKNVILHGDVAHHNFLRSETDELYIIDFDLISIGYPSADYLQYANRILPFLNWSLDELANLKIMKDYLSDKGFMYALAYPTDIFREWNRTIRERYYEDPTKVRQVLDLTLGQYLDRQNFVKEIKNSLN